MCLGLGASAVAHLVNTLPNVGDSNYHIVINVLLRHLSLKQITATGTVRTNRMENAPLHDLGKMANKSRGTSDIVTDVSSNITAVRWKDNKTVDALSIFTGKEPIQYVKRFCNKQKKRVDIKQPNTINIYNKSMGQVDRILQHT